MPTARSDDGDANGARLRKPRRARRAGRVRVRRSKGGCVCACGADVDRAGGGRRVDDAADDDLNWFRDRWVKDFC